MTQTRLIQLPSGTAHATVVDGVLDARGVRYASAGAGRGAPAAAPLVAQAVPTAFPQVPGILDTLLGPALVELPQSEDSFSVRVQAPDSVPSSAALPVLLFVHGGGFTTGSAESRWYEAHRLVAQGRFVLVTVNYRLGALGSVAARDDQSPAFNDLVTASHWVRENIAAFGGDPDQITVAGDSAGAWWAHALSVAPQTEGLFRRTVLVSMPRMKPLSDADAAERRELVGRHLAAACGGEATLADAEVGQVLDAQRAAARDYRGAGFPFAPASSERVEESWGEPSESAALHTSEVLCLTTAHEASAFLLPHGVETYDAAWVTAFLEAHFVDPAAAARVLIRGQDSFADAVAVQTHWQFQSTVHDLARAARVPVRLARLDLTSTLPHAGSPHCFTLPFLFGARDAWHDAPMLDGVADEVFERVSGSLQTMLVDFVHGRGGGAPRWSADAPRVCAVTASSDEHLPVLGADVEVRR